MGKPFRNFREGFFVFEPKNRIFWKSISLGRKNQFFGFLHFYRQKVDFFKPVFKLLTKIKIIWPKNKGAFLELGSLSGFIVNGLKPYKLWQNRGLNNYYVC